MCALPVGCFDDLNITSILTVSFICWRRQACRQEYCCFSRLYIAVYKRIWSAVGGFFCSLFVYNGHASRLVMGSFCRTSKYFPQQVFPANSYLDHVGSLICKSRAPTLVVHPDGPSSRLMATVDVHQSLLTASWRCQHGILPFSSRPAWKRHGLTKCPNVSSHTGVSHRYGCADIRTSASAGLASTVAADAALGSTDVKAILFDMVRSTPYLHPQMFFLLASHTSDGGLLTYGLIDAGWSPLQQREDVPEVRSSAC